MEKKKKEDWGRKQMFTWKHKKTTFVQKGDIREIKRLARDYTMIMMGETIVQFRSYQVVGDKRTSSNWPLLLLSGHLQVR